MTTSAKTLLISIVVSLASATATAQSERPCLGLCKGDYFTEQQGADHLASLRRRLKTKKDWQLHADSIRSHVRRGLELEVFPGKTALNPRFRNKKTLDGYTVESVVFESLPGFFVAGNLYRPTGEFRKKSLAVILEPHGHFPREGDYGRFMKDIQYGAASMAKMGALVFTYDMVGWGESRQVDHKFWKVQVLQTWNSIRVVDFLLTFPEADPDRIGVTGASGGGTQSFMLAAVDDRIKVSMPVVMVSGHFFGGCSCESGMPVHVNGKTVYTNAEIACIIAPKPLLLVSDGNDWTKNNPVVEFPFARHVYGLFKKDDMVELAHFPAEGHDYSKNKRLAAYHFAAKHLGLDLNLIRNADGDISEHFVSLQQQQELTYFTEEERNALLRGEKVYQTFVDTKK